MSSDTVIITSKCKTVIELGKGKETSNLETPDYREEMLNGAKEGNRLEK